MRKLTTKGNYAEYIPWLFWLMLPLAKLYQFLFLPDKYFGDSRTILRYMETVNNMQNDAGAYLFTARFFNKINVFNFKTLQAWATFLAIVYGVILFYIVNKRMKHISLTQMVFFICSLFLIFIYVFNISKDIIQFSIFLIGYAILYTNRIKKASIKLLLCVLLFYWESTVFRSYYILVGIFTIYMYIMIEKYILKAKQLKLYGFISFIIIIMASIYLFMIIASKFMPDEYKDIITARTSVNAVREKSGDVNTIIIDVIKTNSNLGIWMLNYIINSIRMLIPIELLLKNARYFPFVVYQLFITYYLVQSLKCVRRRNDTKFILALSVFCGYLLTSFIFEPDFGSWVRHESAAFPIYAIFTMFEGEYQKRRVS